MDEELNRKVAIKMLLQRRAADSREQEQSLAEARALARMDHPAIVPVYDFGATDEGYCYIVSKFVDGGDLAGLARSSRPSASQAAELVATVADVGNIRK